MLHVEGMPERYRCRVRRIDIVGTEHYAFAGSLDGNLVLVDEPCNSYDSSAIAVELNSKKIGYIPRDKVELFHGREFGTKISDILSGGTVVVAAKTTPSLYIISGE